MGCINGTVIETGLISLGLADKIRIKERKGFNHINQLNANLEEESNKVKNLNEHLEELVEEQTREIKSIMQHIQLGIVVIKGDELLLTDTYSNATLEILNTTSISGRKAIELLMQNVSLSGEQKDQIHSIISTSLDNHVLNFLSNEHLLPLEATLIIDNEEKSIQMDWKPVVDSDDTVEKVIVTIKDVTALIALEEDAKEQKLELAYIGEILGVTAKQFSTFMESGIGFMQDNIRLLSLNAKLDQESLKIIFINLHTIKGAARALGLQLLTPEVHELEQMVSDIMNNKTEKSRDFLLSEHHKIEGILSTYERLNSEKLGRNSGDSVFVPLKLVESIHRSNESLQQMTSVSHSHELKEINQSLEDLTYISASKLFQEVLADAEMLARDLNKEYPTIEVENIDLKFSHEGQAIIRNAFVHIIRNSMDHGLETADDRIAAGKDPVGKISLNFVHDENFLTIRYWDDGAGLNLEAIRNIAKAKNIVSDDVSISSAEIAELIFHSGFSTQ
ncbi:MAG: Hpt domain-containing protein [Pseudobacteriovorax sp.]|nr:Hpt domain-containing protein [Pseudobacteriovorax sp.]